MQRGRLRIPPDKQLHWVTFVNGGRWTEYADEAESRPAPRKSLEEAIADGELR